MKWFVLFILGISCCSCRHKLAVEREPKTIAPDNRPEPGTERLEDQYHTEEPSYEGKTLREWINQIASSRIRVGKVYDALAPGADAPSAEALEATQVIKEMESTALPFLLELLRRGEGRTAVDGFAALGDLASPTVPELLLLLEEPDDTIHYATIQCLGHIGPAAKSAVPLLRDELQFGAQPLVAAAALGGIGPAAKVAVPRLLELLATCPYPRDVISALGRIGDPSAVPALVKIVKRPASERFDLSEAFCRHAAIQALGRIGPEAVQAVPVLVDLLSHEHGRRNVIANSLSGRIIRALSSIGPEAREAIPLLLEIRDRKPPLSALSQPAAAALSKIQASR